MIQPVSLLSPAPGVSAFPSRYSYAIGLGTIRFLGWKTPPLRSALPTTTTLPRLNRQFYIGPGLLPAPRNFTDAPTNKICPVSHSARRLQVGNQPFRSPLLRPSLLLSIPSPTNMLKFGELSLPRVIRGPLQRVPPSHEYQIFSKGRAGCAIRHPEDHTSPVSSAYRV